MTEEEPQLQDDYIMSCWSTIERTETFNQHPYYCDFCNVATDKAMTHEPISCLAEYCNLLFINFIREQLLSEPPVLTTRSIFRDIICRDCFDMYFTYIGEGSSDQTVEYRTNRTVTSVCKQISCMKKKAHGCKKAY